MMIKVTTLDNGGYDWELCPESHPEGSKLDTNQIDFIESRIALTLEAFGSNISDIFYVSV